ncbi:MAG: type II toxin-antitoxin system PemK/MazF family toxin [Anaerolineae bacterium]
MSAAETISLSISKDIADEAEAVATQLGITRDQLFEMVVEAFMRTPYQQPLVADVSTAEDGSKSSAQHDRHQSINQGDIYWAQLAEADISHPYVIVQDNVLNHSRITSVVACALTSNIGRINRPGNVLLEAGEGNLPKPSVVEVSKVFSVNKAQLGEFIGTIDERRIKQIWAGMRFLQTLFHKGG